MIAFKALDYIVYGWALWTLISAGIFSPFVRKFIAKKLLMAELGHNLFLMRKKEIDNFGHQHKDKDGNDCESDFCYSHDSNKARVKIGVNNDEESKEEKSKRKPNRLDGEVVV